MTTPHFFNPATVHGCRVQKFDLSLPPNEIGCMASASVSNAPNYCREPLIVAPVSLLENWEEEVRKFLVPDALPMLTADNDSLVSLRVPHDSIDNRLKAEGLVKDL
jgi:hypothetical protein